MLVTAAAKGDLDLLERTLDGEYGEVSEEDVREAVLRSACHGNKTCLSRLLAHGADPDCEDMDGDTPLMIASSNDHVGEDFINDNLLLIISFQELFLTIKK